MKVRQTRHGFGAYPKGFKASTGLPRGKRVERNKAYKWNKGRIRPLTKTARERLKPQIEKRKAVEAKREKK